MTEQKPEGKKFKFTNLVDGRPVVYGYGKNRDEAEKDALERNSDQVEYNKAREVEEGNKILESKRETEEGKKVEKKGNKK